jgi:hypothetical protein
MSSKDARSEFENMCSAFDQAAAAAPAATREYSFRISGLMIRLSTVGKRLAEEMTPPWMPFVCEDMGQDADLKIDIWDQFESGVSGPQAGRDGDQQNYAALSAHGEDRYIAEERQDRMLWLDRAAGHIVGFTGSAERLNIDERGRPFQRMLSIFLNDKGIQPVHAGLIAWEGQGLLFTGMSGAGKSTSSIACLTAGFGYLGDDFVGLEKNADGTFTGHGIFASCMVKPDHMERFPDLAPHQHPAHHDHEDKSVVYLSDLYPNQIEIDIPIRAIVLPRVVGEGENTFRPATKGEALRAIAPSSVIMFVAGPTARSIDKLVDLIEAVPSYWLELGRDVGGIPDTVRQIAAEVKAK